MRTFAPNMTRTIKAGLAYFALVFGAGFVLDWYARRIRQTRRLTLHWCGRLSAPHNSDVGFPDRAKLPNLIN
jgi:hypothetical protein